MKKTNVWSDGQSTDNNSNRLRQIENITKSTWANHACPRQKPMLTALTHIITPHSRRQTIQSPLHTTENRPLTSSLQDKWKESFSRWFVPEYFLWRREMMMWRDVTAASGREKRSDELRSHVERSIPQTFIRHFRGRRTSTLLLITISTSLHLYKQILLLSDIDKKIHFICLEEKSSVDEFLLYEVRLSSLTSTKHLSEEKDFLHCLQERAMKTNCHLE